jgi:hypothetical protein
MNEIGFRVLPPTDFDPGEVRVIVDGRDLVDLVRAVEQAQAVAEGHPQIAGDYAGLELRSVAPPSKHFWGEPSSPIYGRSGRVQVLECSGCREPGCWPLFCRIDVTQDHVRWSNFENGHRPDWDYGDLGPFEFDRRQYEAALHRLAVAG